MDQSLKDLIRITSATENSLNVTKKDKLLPQELITTDQDAKINKNKTLQLW